MRFTTYARVWMYAGLAWAFFAAAAPDAWSQVNVGGGGNSSSEQTGNQPGSTVIDPQLLRTSVTGFTGFVSRQLARNGGNLGGAILTADLAQGARDQRGAAAGGGLDRAAGWVNFSDTDIEEDVPATLYEGDLRNYLLGVDYQLDDRILAGLAFGLERGEIDTRFNGGTVTTRGVTVSPYASYRLDERWSFDAILGHTRGDIDQVRGAGIRSETDFRRWFAQANANYVTGLDVVDNLLLAGQAGYTYAFEKIDGFTESNGNLVAANRNPLGQVQLGARAGYSLFDIADGWVFHPYGGLRYLHEIQSSRVSVGPGQAEHPNDNDEVQVSLGLDFFSGSKLSGNIEFLRSFARSKFESSVISVNLRWAFGPSGE
ncbi:MAG: autotransporter outer membrane beta-barrel domain-containing protein [Alphaproteobacteria bacterium]|nr:autotransporter outer membrane beta-barrel domain-containing protein [Alphaproteobacteria bacterium]